MEKEQTKACSKGLCLEDLFTKQDPILQPTTLQHLNTDKWVKHIFMYCFPRL